MIAGSDHVVGIVSTIDGGMRRIEVDGHVRFSEWSILQVKEFRNDARTPIEKDGFDREYRPQDLSGCGQNESPHRRHVTSPLIPVCSLVSSENT